MGYENVADIFSQISRLYDRFLSTATAGQVHSWQRELISRMNPYGNWLDVGTGTGEVLKKLGDRYEGLRVGIDPAFGMLRVAKGKCPDCFFLQALGEELPFKDKSFKNVSLSLVFRHLQDKERFIEEAKRVLEEGGKVGIIDIGRFRGTPVLLFLMRTILKPVGSLLFGKEKWDFFIHSVEESYSLEEVRSIFEGKGFCLEYSNRRFFGVVQVAVFVRTA